MICCPHQHFTALFLFATKSTFAPLPLYYIYLCTNYYAISILHSLALTLLHTPLALPYTPDVHYEGVNPLGLGARGKWWGYTPAPARTEKHARTRTQAVPERPPTIHKTTVKRTRPPRKPQKRPRKPPQPLKPRARMR